MVQLVEPPQHAHPVVGQVDEPVAPIHAHEDDGDHRGAWKEAQVRQDDPWDHPFGDLDEGEGERRHEGHDHAHVQNGVQDVLTMAAGEQRSALGRPQPLDDQDDAEDREAERTEHHDAQQLHRSPEVRPAPIGRPADSDQERSEGRDDAGGEIHPVRHERPEAAQRAAPGGGPCQPRRPKRCDYHWPCPPPGPTTELRIRSSLLHRPRSTRCRCWGSNPIHRRTIRAWASPPRQRSICPTGR